MTSNMIAGMQGEFISLINENLDDEFIKLKKQIRSNNVSVAFSGGIDSTIIVYKLRQFGFNPILISTGSKLSKDIEYVKRFAKETHIPLLHILLDKQKVESLAPKILKLLERKLSPSLKRQATKIRFKYPGLKTIPNAMDVSIALCFYLIAYYSPNQYIFTGHGAGDLFGGPKHLMFAKKNLKSLIEKGITAGKIDIARDSIAVSEFSKILINPIFNQDLIKLAKQIPPNLKVTSQRTKFIWYLYAKSLGLPDYILNREYKSMQYSCGIYNWVRKFMLKTGLGKAQGSQ